MFNGSIILRRKPFLLALLVIVIVLPIVLYLYKENRRLKAGSDEDLAALVQEVGKVAVLPEDETPTLLSVMDTEKLKGQSLFELAKNGDKILIYKNAKRAYMYRPSEKKLVDIAPVTDGDISAHTYSVAIYGLDKGLSAIPAVERTLKDKVANVTVKSKQVAKLKYDKTTVIDLSGSKASEALQLANVLGGEVSTLKTGEQKPDGVDFLIIVIP